MQCRRRFRRTGAHLGFRCVSMRQMPFPTGNQQDCSGFPHQFQQRVENSKREKIPSQQFICIAGKSAVWNLLWRIVEWDFHNLCKVRHHAAGFSTKFSTNFPFPLHNLSPFPRRKNFSTFPDSFHECPVGKKSPEFPVKSWVSTFPGSLLVLLYLFYLSILSLCSFAASFLE